jgi:hypothetical protein
MHRLVGVLTICVALVVVVERTEAQAAEPKAPLRGILVRPERVTLEYLKAWKIKGISAVVVVLDEASKRHWNQISTVVEKAELMVWPWIEVARNPAMADAHPEWMAAPGGHHDDWRRRFPTAPKAKTGEVIKAWPWVPIGYAPAFEAQRKRLIALLGDLPGTWAGAFLNDLQGGPSSCGCGNDQCRWALDYGTPSTALKTPGDDAAARLVAELRAHHSGKAVIPVWVTECETADLPGAKDGTGLCGGVPCAARDCWPRYVRNWNPLVQATNGPIAVALWPETFQRNPERWHDTGLALFQRPPRDGTSLVPQKSVAVVQAWDKSDAAVAAILVRTKSLAPAWVMALDPIDQSWEPRVVAIPHQE